MKKEWKESFEKIDKILNSRKRILVTSHQNPDADAVGSVLLVGDILKEKRHDVYLYLPSPPPLSLSFLRGFFEIKTEIKNFLPEVLFCLDYGDFKRLNLPQFVLNSSPLIVTIDHHLKSDQRGVVKVIDCQACSTTEILYYWMKFQDININQHQATYILAGILGDTGGFRYSLPRSETFKIVSELLLKGGQFEKIIRNVLFPHSSLCFYKLWGKILSKTSFFSKKEVVYSYLSFEEKRECTNISLTDFDGIANLICNLSPKKVGLFLIEYEKGKVKGSLRSEREGVDVAEIAKKLGGGGHKYAAGFEQRGEIKEILRKISELI